MGHNIIDRNSFTKTLYYYHYPKAVECFCFKVYLFTLYKHTILYFYFNNVRVAVSDKSEYYIQAYRLYRRASGRSIEHQQNLIIFSIRTRLLSIIKI